jgi:hypothetical protein
LIVAGKDIEKDIEAATIVSIAITMDDYCWGQEIALE